MIIFFNNQNFDTFELKRWKSSQITLWSTKGFFSKTTSTSFRFSKILSNHRWSWKKGFPAWPLCDLTSFLIFKAFNNCYIGWSVKGFSACPLLLSFISQKSRQITEWSWKKGFSAWPLGDLTSFLICKAF